MKNTSFFCPLRRCASLLLLLALSFGGRAQDGKVCKYWVSFADKQGTAFTLSSPSAYLSPRALERRRRQSVDIDSLDLPVSPRYVEALEAAGYRVQDRSKWLNGAVVYSSDSLAAAVLDTFPFVAGAVLLERSRTTAPLVPAHDDGSAVPPLPFDTAFGMEYYHAAYPQISQLRGQQLHRAGFRGRGLLIGVCDGGFPGADTIALFDSLRTQGRLLAARDFVWDSSSVFNVHSHGTAVLSTLASCQPGICVGAAPEASYVLCRTENTQTETPLEMYNWVAAAEFLDSIGADIITTSLGYFQFDDTLFNYSLADLDGHTSPISRGASVAASRGMLVVQAAGNNGRERPPFLGMPSDAFGVLTVGAVDTAGAAASFTSPGPTADGRVKPDVAALGVNVGVANPFGGMKLSSGTSFACPIMAGMMACLWQRYPRLLPSQLCDSVRSWGSQAAEPDNYAGYGVPDFSLALHGRPAAVVEAEPLRLLFCPNPARRGEAVRLSLPPVGEAVLTVADAMGRTLFRRAVGCIETLLPPLAPGIYFVRLVTARGAVCRRLAIE